MYIANPTVLTIDSVDFKDHVKGVTLSGGEEIIDARTFGAPRATSTGGGMDSVTLHCLWSDTLAVLIATEAGTDVTFALGMDGGSWGGTVHVPDAPPTPAANVGAIVEVDLVLGVTDELAYTPAA